MAEENDSTPAAIRSFERTMARIYTSPQAATARFWEAVDLLGLDPARGLLAEEPEAFGQMYAHIRGRDDPRPTREGLLGQATREARQAFLFRGLRQPPDRFEGPMTVLRERELRSRAAVEAIVARHFQEPARAMEALTQLALSASPRAAAETVASISPELGPARQGRPQPVGTERRVIAKWARRLRRLQAPAAYADRALVRFRRALARHFTDPIAVEEIWREQVRQTGPHAASRTLVQKSDEYLPFAVATNPRISWTLMQRATDLARAEHRAHSAGARRSDLCLTPNAPLFAAARAWSHASRLAEAAELERRAHERIEDLERLAGRWNAARKRLDVATSECRNRLRLVVHDPAAVIARCLEAGDDIRSRMIHTLTTVPALAEREFGPAGALVESHWKPFARESRTARAAREAPLAASWLEHLVTSRDAEYSTRVALANRLDRWWDEPAALEKEATAKVERLRGRATDLALLRRQLSERPPEPALLAEVSRWPDELRQRMQHHMGPQRGHTPQIASARSVALEMW